MITLKHDNLRWSDCIFQSGQLRPKGTLTLGVFRGEGIGPEVIGGALEVLRVLQDHLNLKIDIQFGGPIGRDAEREGGSDLSEDAVAFCSEIFSRGGAVLSGPGGGRYVYDLRKRFDLFFKISPLIVCPELLGACRLKPACVDGANIILVRENIGGIYQGSSCADVAADGGRRVQHTFADDESTVRRFLSAAARLSKMRRGTMTVVCKDSGVPGISALWRECANDVASASGVSCEMVDIDHMAYRLIQHTHEFDVIAAPNMCGDVLADLGAALLGSRGVSFSGNYAPDGAAVYQTNHGSAYDIAGTDRANPAGQIFSLAMALRESFGLAAESEQVEHAVRTVWAAGWRTADVTESGCRIIGTKEMVSRITDRLSEIVQEKQAAA